MPNAIEYCIKEIKQSNVKGLDLVYYKVDFFDKQRGAIRILGSHFSQSAHKKLMTIAHVGALHNRRLFQKFGKFSTEYKASGDYEFFMRTNGDIKSLFLVDPNSQAPIKKGLEKIFVNSKVGMAPFKLVEEYKEVSVGKTYRNIYKCVMGQTP